MLQIMAYTFESLKFLLAIFTKSVALTGNESVEQNIMLQRPKKLPQKLLAIHEKYNVPERLNFWHKALDFGTKMI